MAHELEIVNGQAQMAYVGEVPWHGLGTKVPADLTPDQFMTTAGLDWTVDKENMTTTSGVVVPGKQALVRSSDNKVLDVVGTGWNPVQNSEAFEFFNDYVMAGDMEMHTAGSLKGGQMVWALAKMEQYKSMAEFLGGKRATGENVIQYFNEVFGAPAKEKVDNVIPFTSRNAKMAMEQLETQPGANFAEGSWWQAFNAVTYMTDHLQGREGDSRLVSAWYGRNRKVKLNALDKALEYAEAA
jgi:hypothetical protein